MSKEKLICVLCNKPMEDPYGHNAQPLAEGRCCSNCNINRVIPERVSLVYVDMVKKETKEEQDD